MLNELKAVCKANKLNDTSSTNPASLAAGLMQLLSSGGKKVPVINKVLKNVFRQCFDPSIKYHKSYAIAKAHHERLKWVFDESLGWLVLASIDETQIQHLLMWQDLSAHLYFELPVKTLGGVEIVFAWHQQRQGCFSVQEHRIKGQDLIEVDTASFSWCDVENRHQLKIKLWNAMRPDLLRTDRLSDDETNALNADLSSFREDDDQPRHYAFVVKYDEMTDDAFKQCYQDLLNELDELPLIRFGVQGSDDSLFCTYEHHLTSAIKSFLLTRDELSS